MINKSLNCNPYEDIKDMIYNPNNPIMASIHKLRLLKIYVCTRMVNLEPKSFMTKTSMMIT